MCDTCGCGDREMVPVQLEKKILATNERTAAHNRQHFAGRGVLAVNLMGSPGAGKTAVLEATARAFAGRARLGALAGDLETERDAERLRKAGIPTVSISTGTACHLDAGMVHHALHGFDWADLDYLFVENVGNLVCPAVYDLGQAVNVVALSVTEGEDKPLKYPVMFRKADLVLVTKVDLLPHLPGVSLGAVEDALAHVMPDPQMMLVSVTASRGLEDWCTWLDDRRARLLAAPHAYGAVDAPAHDHDHQHDHLHARGEAVGHGTGPRP